MKYIVSVMVLLVALSTGFGQGRDRRHERQDNRPRVQIVVRRDRDNRRYEDFRNRRTQVSTFELFYYDVAQVERQDGYRDGFLAGREDRRCHRRYDPERAYQFRDTYPRAYRGGFLEGYANGWNR